MKSSSIGYATSKYTYPVVVIPGISHASFLSGTPPAKVQETDLRATVSEKQAIEDISAVVAAFITVTRLGKDSAAAGTARQTIDHYIDDVTTPLVQPILDMYALEGASFMSSFNNKSPIVEFAQQYVAGDLVNSEDLKEIDAYKAEQYIVEGDFAHSKPQIQNITNGGEADIASYSHPRYNWMTDEHIDAAGYYGAYEVGAKMKSREAIYKFFGQDFSNTKESSCQEINQAIYQKVIQSLPKDYPALKRYNEDGQ